ncbi:MAG: hypothetical protein ACFFC7_27405 [Candidatus Hermodarchaeota archaeon]
MADCTNLANCNFFKSYEKDESKKTALQGLARKYCQGDKQDRCIRKIISRELGDSSKVPPNMLPNGYALPGTDKSMWSTEVRAILKHLWKK